jgi:flagellar motor component MotA
MKTIIIAGFIGALLVSVESVAFVGLLAFIVVVFGILERILKKTNYALILETSAGNQTLITSPDKEFMEKLVSKIYEVMNHEDLPANYVFNMEDRSINVAGDIGGHAISGDVQNSF